jgi:hypothetical protein
MLKLITDSVFRVLKNAQEIQLKVQGYGSLHFYTFVFILREIMWLLLVAQIYANHNSTQSLRMQLQRQSHSYMDVEIVEFWGPNDMKLNVKRSSLKFKAMGAFIFILLYLYCVKLCDCFYEFISIFHNILYRILLKFIDVSSCSFRCAPLAKRHNISITRGRSPGLSQERM